MDEIRGEMEGHVAKEEQVLTTMMRLGRSPIIAHADQFKARNYLANCFRLPEDACGSRYALRAGAGMFAEDLVAHMYLENENLFPRSAGCGR